MRDLSLARGLVSQLAWPQNGFTRWLESSRAAMMCDFVTCLNSIVSGSFKYNQERLDM